MKRPAAATAGGAEKKRATEIAGKCSEVVAALTKTDTLPDVVRKMLSTMARSGCLTTDAANRHPFQVKTVDMVGQTLASIKVKLQEDVVTAQAKVDGADVEKASRAEAVEAAAKKLAELEQIAKTAREAMDADKAAEAVAKLAMSAAEKTISSTESDLTSAEKMKAELESTRKDVFEPLKTSKATGLQGRRDLSNLVKVLKESGCESSLADSLTETFGKEVEARATFDNIVINEIESQMTKQVAELEATVSQGETRKLEAANSKSTAEADHAASMAKLAASKDALTAADVAVSDGKKALAEGKVAMASYEKDMKGAAAALSSTQSDLDKFLNGALKSFEDLKDLAPPQSEPAEIDTIKDPVGVDTDSIGVAE
jgi:hypothetical protein